MKRASFLLLALAASALTFGRLAAETTTTQATVARVTGAATVTLADGSTAPLTAGMKVAQGSTITTGADGDVYLESHAGYVTAIKNDSTVLLEEISVTTTGGKVTEEKTMLDLKDGNLVAKLDPTKKAVNNYQVRTPKGVAAARGTVFTVQYKGGTYTIAVVNGVVSITPPAGASLGTAAITVGSGQAALSTKNGNLSTPMALTKMADVLRSIGDRGAGKVAHEKAADFFDKSASELNELLAVAVATVAVAAQNNIGGTTAAEAAAVAKAIFTAVPAAAEHAGALLNKSGVTSGAVLNAVKAVVPASASDAFNSGVSTGTYTPNPNTTVANPGSDTSRGANQATTPQKIDPSTVSRSN